jgi:hypothetical protein
MNKHPKLSDRRHGSLPRDTAHKISSKKATGTFAYDVQGRRGISYEYDL